MSAEMNEENRFVTGNEVVARAALAAHAGLMIGYPITPQNEIMYYWTRLNEPAAFLQTEDELSAGFATLGAVLAGRRAFTATAGPGTVLMQESWNMAEMLRLPLVAIVQQRGGPSTATVIYSQQEVMMCCYGGNGEGFRIVYSTAGNQDLYDYTLKAFDTAWRYRFPTIVLGDGYQAKMRESVMLYPPSARGMEPIAVEPLMGAGGRCPSERPPRHLKNTYNTEEELLAVVDALGADYERAASELVEYDSDHVGDAELLLVAHGIVSRAAHEAMRVLRSEGLRVGWFRPITLRPFPSRALKMVAARCRGLLVVESSRDQLKRLVAENIFGYTTPLYSYGRPGKSIETEEICAQARLLLKGGGRK